jgi:hypothetical protein
MPDLAELPPPVVLDQRLDALDPQDRSALGAKLGRGPALNFSLEPAYARFKRINAPSLRYPVGGAPERLQEALDG